MKKQEENYTKVPNIILDDTTLNVYEFRILSHIIRQTIGYNKKSDGISLSQFNKATGVGVSKIKTTLLELKAKKYIRMSQQTAKHGGKSYNRYRLTLSHHMANHSHDMANPQPPHDQPHSHDMAIQKKIEQKKIDKRREREHTADNIFYSLSGNELKREINSFLNDSSVEARNKSAYKTKLRQQIDKEHPQTLETFEEWYLAARCKKLRDQYSGKTYHGDSISSIHSYIDTDGFSNENKFILQTIDSKGQMHTKCYTNLKEIEHALHD